MTLEPSVIISIVGGVIALFGTMFWVGHRQGVISTRIETLQGQMKRALEDIDLVKSSLIRRGKAELVSKGWATFGSPIHLGQVAIEKILPFLQEFVPFYLNVKRENPNITDQEFIWKLEQQFGDKIIEKICAPEGLSNYGCLVAILEVCKLQGDGGAPHGPK